MISLDDCKTKIFEIRFEKKKSLIQPIFFTFFAFPPYPLIFRKGVLHKVMSVNLHPTIPFFPDQINMAVFFWHLLKSDLASVRYCMYSEYPYTFYKVPETHGHVLLVTLFILVFHIFLRFPCVGRLRFGALLDPKL